jgi:hypothetical protein
MIWYVAIDFLFVSLSINILILIFSLIFILCSIYFLVSLCLIVSQFNLSFSFSLVAYRRVDEQEESARGNAAGDAVRIPIQGPGQHLCVLRSTDCDLPFGQQETSLFQCQFEGELDRLFAFFLLF